MDAKLDANPPAGRIRVSDAVISKLAIAEAHAVEGVLDVRGLVLGAVVGGIAGAAVGLMQAGPAGLALGGPAGSVAGVAAAKMIEGERQRRSLINISKDQPVIALKLTARYGANLERLADNVRDQVKDAILQAVGVEPRRIDVEFVEVHGSYSGL